MIAPSIQQRVLPPERLGQMVDFSGRADSTPELQQFLSEHGYILLRRALAHDAVMAAREEVMSRLRDVGEVDDPPIEGRATWQSTRPDPASDRGEFWRSVNNGEALRAVTHGQPTRDIVAGVLGEPARGHDLMYLRPMAPGGVTPLHYDYPFFAGDSERIHTVWIPIGHVPMADGPLVIIERSFEFDDLLDPIREIDFKNDRSNDNVQQAAYDAQNELHPIDLAAQRGVRLLSTDFEAGDLLVFSGFTLHGSLDNNSPQERIRLSCDVRYQPAADPHTDKRYFGEHPKGSKGGGYADMRGAKPIAKE